MIIPLAQYPLHPRTNVWYTIYTNYWNSAIVLIIDVSKVDCLTASHRVASKRPQVPLLR